MEYVLEAEITFVDPAARSVVFSYLESRRRVGIARPRAVLAGASAPTFQSEIAPVSPSLPESAVALGATLGVPWRCEVAFVDRATLDAAYRYLARYKTLLMGFVARGSSGRVRAHECRHDEGGTCDEATVRETIWGRETP